MSEYVRRKDADEGGTTVCYTCGAFLHWKYEAQAGHAIGGRHNAVLFDTDIIRPQCFACNAKHIGNGRPHIFITKLIQENGFEWWQQKESGSRLVKKYDRADLEALIEEFQQKLQELEPA